MEKVEKEEKTAKEVRKEIDILTTKIDNLLLLCLRG